MCNFTCPNLSPYKQALGKPTSESGSRVAFSDVKKTTPLYLGQMMAFKRISETSEAM